MSNKVPAIKLEKIFFKYNSNQKDWILKNINCDIPASKYTVLIGHNGSGKSTVSKIMTGIVKPSNGSVLIFGEKIVKGTLAELRKKIGIVFQNPDNQFIGTTVKNDIIFGLENNNVAPSKMDKIIDDAANVVGIKHLYNFAPQRLSGGQKQKVAIAGILALNNNIVIFDEATSMLDPKGKISIKKIMLELSKDPDKTIISITHDMEEVVQADHVIVLDRGRVFLSGTPTFVFSHAEELRKIGLDTPLVYSLSEYLKKFDSKFEPTINFKEFVKQCQ